jgi:hypothetical protein
VSEISGQKGCKDHQNWFGNMPVITISNAFGPCQWFGHGRNHGKMRGFFVADFHHTMIHQIKRTSLENDGTCLVSWDLHQNMIYHPRYVRLYYDYRCML